MPSITDTPPQNIQDELAELATTLDADVPAKALDRNLLIATWNLRVFGDLTEKWLASETDSPKRDLHSLLCIKEIVSRFDVIALQEVRGNIKAAGLQAVERDGRFVRLPASTDGTSG